MQYMRPFNPYVEDIDMYLEEAKERHLFVPNQEKLKQWAARVNAQNEEIVKRDEKAIQENRLKKKLEQDRIEEAKKTKEQKLREEEKDYEQYLRRFDKKYKKGRYDPKFNPPSSYSLVPATYTGWKPRMWSTDGTEVQPHFEPNSFEISNFDIVVDSASKSSFPSSFPKFNTTWTDTNKTNDITTQPFDITDPYFASLAASYHTFCTTGFSLQHLNSEDLFVKSICNYYVYYWMNVLLRSPKTVPDTVKKYLKKNHPIHKVWTKEFHQGQETATWWMKRQPEYKQGKIRNARPSFGTAGTRFGQAGIDYEKVTYIGPRGDDDWKDLIPKTSLGLTKQGQKMFQQSLESLVFSILDAQAKTGWSITEQGAKSFQTQDVFRKLVQDTIVQHDVTVTINNMKRAIVDTGVSLNFAIVPKTILIPSDMRLQKKIPGFNNILTLVRGNMHFGKNNDINVRESTPVKDTSQDDNNTNQSDTKQSSEKHPDSYYKEQKPVAKSKEREGVKIEIIGGVVAGLFLRLLMWLV